MAEVKNAFIKSKMNKDLDSRLLPSGEYRDGFNIQVSKSEGEDVGALENALGNSKALINTSGNNPVYVDFSVLAGHATETLKSIGVYSDVVSSTIFVFLTDYIDPSFPASLSYSSTALNYIYSYNTLTTEAYQLASGSYLNFSQTHPINAVNTLENLLFWTDNRNQPRKINISTAQSNSSYYNSEDLISIAKYNPYEVIELYYQDTSEFVPNSTSVSNPNYNQWVCAAQDVTSLKLPDGTTDNMYYDAKWPGDPDYLKNKFVSFSYRFKFSDGEYSILAPFTQEAFIPQQDGYFLSGDEDSTYRSSIVEFMRNKATNVKLQIPLPTQAQNLEATYDVAQIEIVWKESESLAVKVLDSIISSDLVGLSSDFYSYDYQSRKPYKTLPESEIIRVYDKVPVRALSQEIISNRVVYGNFQDKHTPPSTINYDIAVTEKSTFDVSNTNNSLYTTSQIEYPEHTLKQNRNYQVGIVLSDRYGRQSTTILSPIDTQIKTITTGGNDLNFKGSTYYHPYKGEPVSPSVSDVHSWPGDSLKILINAGVNSVPNITTGTPGLWNGDPNSPSYNPLGWYSYKIVVKQTETDYYNVYLPGILNDYPDYKYNQRSDMPDPINTVAHISLISDNINKVPRDLTEVGPEQLQYRSDVKLFGRVTPNFSDGVAPTYNEPYYPKNNTMTVAAISEQDNMFVDVAKNRQPPYSTIYQTDSDPYIARISQNNVSVAASTPLPKPIGSSQVNSLTGYDRDNIFLGVFETAPVESLLDIFYETSTSGLISDFNLLAGNDNGTLEGWNSNNQDGFRYTQTEASDSGITVVQDFTATLPSDLGNGVPILNAEIKLVNVSNGQGTVITSDWTLVDGTDVNGNKTYNLNVVNPKYFETNLLSNTFIFTFSVINKTDPNNIIDYGNVDVPAVTLGNENPSITNATGFPSIPGNRTDPSIPIYTFLGTNGTVVSGKESANLTWSLTEQVPESTPSITINSSDGQVFAPLDISGNYSFRVTVIDSGGATDTAVIGAVAGKQPINSGFGKYNSSNSNQPDISKGIQSTGFFWCDDYSTALADPYPNNFNSLTPSGRTSGIPALSLPQSGFNNTSADIQSSGNVDITTQDSEGNSYRMVNSNYKTSSRDNSVGNGNNSLTDGTAFLKVDFKFKQWPYTAYTSSSANIRPNYNTVSWTAYLQIRPSGGSWQSVLDVEGKQIRFGSEQININNASLNGTANDFAETGVLKNPTSYQITSGADANRVAEDSVGAAAWFPQTVNQDSVSSTVSKVFVFGKDQGYGQTADQHGDYRLLILYPADGGQSTGGEFTSKVIPKPLGTQSSWNDINPYKTRGASYASSRITVDISYGDFYYPTFTESSSEVYAYRVSPTGRATRAESENLVTNNPTTFQTVYAREWSLKYVTQFFGEQSLTQKWNPGARQGDYYIYESVQEINSVNSKYGAENSSFSSNSVNETDMAASNNSERRYTAQFDTYGKKIKQSALPLSGGAYETYVPSSNGGGGSGGGPSGPV